MRLFILALFLAILPLPAFADDAVAAAKAAASNFEQSKALAEGGNVTAEYNLAEIYIKGAGVKQDFAEAAKWYAKAAEAGQPDAQSRLGVMYVKGIGVAHDYEKAGQWFMLAAKQDNIDAETYLGFLYAGGMGFKKDNAQALLWFKRAAEAGSVLAQYNTAVMYEKGLGAAQNDLAASNYYRMAAEQGNADAAFSLGQDYAVGKAGIGQDPLEAYAWLSVADTLGNTDAASLRESVLQSLSTRDLTKAQILFKKYLALYGHIPQAAP
jgi:uncharacterized protein